MSSAPLRSELAAPDAATRITRIAPTTGWSALRLRELWEYRELLYFLVWRDVKVKYKQTVVGALWAVLQPLVMMLLFVAIFGRFSQLRPAGLPYAVFVYSGLLPWQLFAASLAAASSSLVANQQLVTKVYVPRLLIPLGATLNGSIDFVLAFVVLLAVMAFYGVVPAVTAVLVPVFLVFIIATALSAGIWLAALNVRFRDIQYVVPFLVQLWFFVTPILYDPAKVFPHRLLPLFGLNPMFGVVEGFRWALLGRASQAGATTAVSAVVVVVLIASGLMYFRRVEKSFADLV